VLAAENSPYASFVADRSGTYVVSLVVNDGQLDSDPQRPHTVTITAVSSTEAVVGKLRTIMSFFNSVNPGVFTNPNMRNTLTNKINAVLQDIEGGLFQDAKDKLTNDLLAKVDGCAKSGAPDKNDWVRDCTTQLQEYYLILEAISLLGQL
jgi:hypothetical protein